MVGRSIGPYLVLERLGSGGMGDVFLAEDQRLHRRVALKQLRDTPTSSQSRHTLLREARAAGALNHPNIATIHDVVENEDSVCIVMEYVEGESLRSALKRGPLPVDRAIAVGREVLDALAAAHGRGILHCDLKPANIILTPAGHVKVLDFGLARRFALPTSETTTASIDETVARSEQVAGTAGYMAPERVTGAPIGPRSDVYSAGVVLFEMLTGRKPFEGRDLVATAMTALTQPPESPSHLNAEIPEPVSAVVVRALARDPLERFPTAAEFEEELTRVGGSSTVRRLSIGALRRKMPSPIWFALAGLTLAVVAWLASYAYAPWRARDGAAPRPPAVAVKPFANLSGLASNDPLGVGIADDLTARLAALPSITVVSRAETAAYVAEHPNSRTLAHDLGVGYVVDGSLEKTSDKLHASVTLARSDGSVAWGQTYEAGADGLFALQQEIAESVADALAQRMDATLSVSDRRRLAEPPTRNIEAFADYSQGQMFLQRHDTKDSVDRAIAAFQRAIEKDPRFASAHAGLGAAYWSKYQITNDAALTARAIDATLEAQRLDPRAAGVHVTLGQIYAGMGRTDNAIQELRRALALHPNETDAHRLLGDALAAKGRVDDAVREYRNGIALVPDYFRNYNSLGATLLEAGRFSEAAEAFRRVTELQPDLSSGFNGLGIAQLQLGKPNDALASFSRAQQLDPNDDASLSNIGTIEYWLGRFEDARRTYERALQLEPASAAMHRNLADTLMRLSDAKRARAEYDRAMALTESQLKVNPKDTTALTRAALIEARLERQGAARAFADQALAVAPRDNEVLFCSAAVHALAGETDAALNQLEQAVNAGYSKVLARYDDNLWPLRSSPRYQALLGPTPGPTSEPQ